MPPDPNTDPREPSPDMANAPAGEVPDGAHSEVLSRWVATHNRALHAFLMVRLRDEQEARDVAQEAYARVLQLHRPDTLSFLRAYLFKPANIAINRVRQRTLRGRIDEAQACEEPVESLDPERWALGQEDVEILKRALLELPPKCRQAFVLHRFREWDIDRVGAELGIQPRMVRHYLLQAGLYCKLRIRGLSAAEAKAQVHK